MICLSRKASLFFSLTISYGIVINNFIQVDAANYDDDSYQQQQSFKTCEDTPIYVSGMSVACDSPGSYYYGSNKYRNNPYCVAGDKLKIELEFEILEELGNGISPYMYLHVDENGYKGEVLYESENLCAHSGLKSVDGAACPAVGEYKLSISVYLDEYSHSSEAFLPKAIIGFMEYNDGSYDLGGVNLNRCGKSIWTNATVRSYANSVGNFFLTFGILILAIASVVAFGYIMYLQMLPEQPNGVDQFNLVDDDWEGGNYVKNAINWSNDKSLVGILDN